MASRASSMKVESSLLALAVGFGIGCSAPVEGDGQNGGAHARSHSTLKSDRFALATSTSASAPATATTATTATTTSALPTTSSGTAGVFTTGTTIANVQGTWGTPPPAEGPPLATLNAPLGLSVTDLLRLASGGVQGAVTAANEKTNDYSVSFSYVTSSPVMLATQYEDRPNEFYASIPFDLTYTVSINYGGPTLTITQSSDIEVSCEGWQTGSGTVLAQIVFEPAYFDPEQYNNVITGAVQQRIQAAVSGLPLGPRTLFKDANLCSTLGAYTSAQNGNAGDEIVYDYPVTPRASVTPPISVTVLQVQRLTAEQGGVPEYEAIEQPYLQLWANETFFSLSLPPMTEGQIYVPSNAVVQTNPLNDQLLLIADMQYSGFTLPIGQSDATFTAFGRSNSFGSGTVALQTPKSWEVVGPTLPGSNKPNVFPVTMAGYELTLQISVPPQLITLGVSASQ